MFYRLCLFIFSLNCLFMRYCAISSHILANCSFEMNLLQLPFFYRLHWRFRKWKTRARWTSTLKIKQIEDPGNCDSFKFETYKIGRKQEKYVLFWKSYSVIIISQYVLVRCGRYHGNTIVKFRTPLSDTVCLT